MNQNKNKKNLFGDRSQAALDLASFDNLKDLVSKASVFKNKEEHRFSPEGHLHAASALTSENQSRCEGILKFFEAWDAANQSVSKGPIHERKIADLLDVSVLHFNVAWGSASGTKSSIPAPKQFSDTSPSFTTVFAKWISEQATKGVTRGHQIVVDLALNRIFEKSSDVNSETESKSWLRLTFDSRIQSIKAFRNWAKNKVEYCKELDRSVCTPILLSAGNHGVVMWLTVDLFKDGFGTLAPDIFSLGWSQLAAKPTIDWSSVASGSTPNTTEAENEAQLEQEDTTGILYSFDKMWELSRLGKLGFSGRWRITNRPTTNCAASILEERPIDTHYIGSYTGRSAECAMIVCLLAASGFVYDAVPATVKELPTPLPERVSLNSVFAATGTVTLSDESTGASSPSETSIQDVRTALLGEVFDVDRKCGACTRYKLEQVETSATNIIDTIVLSQGQFDKQSQKEESDVWKANQPAQQDSPFRGVHFQPCKTVQDALNWMLSVNQWKRIWNEAKLRDWEKQWDVVRNEFGQPISRDIDQDGNHVVVALEKGVNTGSIEYMRKPFGGAKKPPTALVEEDSQSNAEDEQDEDDNGAIVG